MNEFKASDQQQEAMKKEAEKPGNRSEITPDMSAEIETILFSELSSLWNNGVDISRTCRLCPDNAPKNKGRGRKEKKTRDEWKWDAILACIHVCDKMKIEYDALMDITQVQVNSLIEMFYEHGTVHDLLTLLEKHLHVPCATQHVSSENLRISRDQIMETVIESIHEIRNLQIGIDCLNEKTSLGIGESDENDRRLDFAEIVCDLIDQWDFPDISEEKPPDKVLYGTIGQLSRWLHRRYIEIVHTGI